MSDDFEDKPRRAKKEGSAEGKDNTVKVLLIVFGSFFGLMLLVCCGAGAWGYFWFQRNLGQVALTTPVDIQKLTAEMTDITIPAEFVPQSGSSIPPLGIKTVQYGWCPTGTCPPNNGPAIGNENSLNLSSFNFGEKDGTATPDFSVDDASDEVLKAQWKEFTKSEHTFDIRGKSCKFLIVKGEEFAALDMDDINDDLPQEVPGVQKSALPEGEAATNEPVEIDETNSDDPAMEEPQASDPSASTMPGTGKQIVQVSGTFPGKEAECTLLIRLNAEDYQEEKILELLKSIR